MQPTVETTHECLASTVEQIRNGDVLCILCGEIASVAHCWIPTDRLQQQLYTPYNRSRTIGYGLCDLCDMDLSDDLYDTIAQKLITFIRTVHPFMPRSKLPAIFLN
jgi:hypothetical protein